MSTSTVHPPALSLVNAQPVASLAARPAHPPRVDAGLWRGLWFGILVSVPMWLALLWLVSLL